MSLESCLYTAQRISVYDDALIIHHTCMIQVLNQLILLANSAGLSKILVYTTVYKGMAFLSDPAQEYVELIRAVARRDPSRNDIGE